MLKIGITGGIGSGKSTVARMFSLLGIPVYDADTRARQLMNEDALLKEKLMETFGAEIYTHNELNRTKLASLVFNNEDKLAQLNAIVHPATIKDAADWMLQQDAAYTLKEAALIFESGSQQGLDYVIGVFAPEPLRIQRVIKRDGSTAEQVKARMRKQLTESIKMKLCDFIITNDEQQLVTPQVLHIHQKLIAIHHANKK
jgi:dephospho-CoA kinase